MKILLISEFFPTRDLRFSGGVEARTFFLAKFLAKTHQVFIITARLPKNPIQEKLFQFVVYRPGPVRKYAPTVGNILERAIFTKEAIKLGKELNVDVIDGANFIAHFIAKQIGKERRIPTVAWYPDVWIGSWIQNAGILGIFGEILERINFLMGYDAYIAISKQTAAKLKQFAKGKIYMIPCGVDKNEFKKNVKKFQNPTIITIARLAKYKNLKTLVFAFAHLSTKIKDARLIIIGKGPEFNNLKNLVRVLKIESKVKFLSNLTREELIKIICASHIFCQPSLVEGFGIATLEAAAAGLPYVNSDIATHREVNRGGQGGFLVDPQNSLLFSKRFYELLSKKSLYEQKSQEAKDLAKMYSWEDVARETEKVYKSLL